MKETQLPENGIVLEEELKTTCNLCGSRLNRSYEWSMPFPEDDEFYLYVKEYCPKYCMDFSRFSPIGNRRIVFQQISTKFGRGDVDLVLEYLRKNGYELFE